MHLGASILLMSGGALLLACGGDLAIGGEPDGGGSPLDSGNVVADSNTNDTALADAGGGDDTGIDSSAPILLNPDASVGGLCAAVDAGETGDAGDASDTGSTGDGLEAGNGLDAGDRLEAGDEGATVMCGCTRRPGVGNSFQCPAGSGLNSSTTVGPSGGTVAIEGSQGVASGVSAQVTFAPGALAAPVRIVLSETAIAPPRDILDWSPVYHVYAAPAALALAAPATLRLPDSNSLSESVDLSIWFSPDGSCFTRVEDSYTNAGFMQGSIRQLGYLIVGTPRTGSTSACP